MLVINFALAIIMFGVAIEIEFKHFKEVLKHPKSMMVGVFAQFIALPVLTFLFILLIKPTASVALGMILVAASPGGNISNFMTSLAKGNSALSISLTAFATVMAIFMTPLNFSFWGNLYTETSGTLIPIKIDAYQMVKTVMLLLGIPVILGLLFRKYFTELALKIAKPLKTFSLIFFIGLIVGALSMNFDFFIDYIHLIVLMVFAHNLIALFTGYSLAVVFKLPKIDRRTLSIETGIQNSGLALVLIFNPKLFDGLGGMAFVAAWWGIWHIISGLVVANFFKRIPTGDDA
ncbi:MAG: bile acid:sodium symporter family protein [Flavobacteriales bacterium]|nr:bile acid:sodium symporter family protein [Flavobacteriales bacterium]